MVLWIIPTVLFLAGVRAEQRCHVCVPGPGAAPEVEVMFPNTSLTPCHQSTQVLTCPEHYWGCLTETRGPHVTRSCAKVAMDSCRSANGVEYCYCAGQLCNAPPAPADVVTDDEDLGEGSGLGPEPPWLSTPSTTTSTVPPGGNLSRPASAAPTTTQLLPAVTAGAAIVATVWR